MQGRLNHHVGQALASVCNAMDVDMSFGAYQGCKDRPVSPGIPDIVALSGTLDLRIVRIKTPWVALHHLLYIKYQGGLAYRLLLGKLINWFSAILPKSQNVNQDSY